MSRIVALIASALGAALIAGCGGLQPEDPGLVLKQGGQALDSIHTITAALKVVKGTISFQGFSLVSANAAVRLPDETDTGYLVRDKDILIGFQVVIVAGHTFFKPPLLKFTELSPEQAADIPDLAKMFDRTAGLPAVMPAGRDPKYLGAEQVDGVDSHKVSATYSADAIKGVLPQLSAQGDVTATVWVGGSDHYIRKAVLTGKFGDNGTDASVEVDLSGFNGPVNIASPARAS
jgi:hypothetical protein